MLAAGADEAAQGAVGTVALAVGIAGSNEAALQGRGDHGDQGVMHNSIAEGGGAHQPGLGFADHELAIGTRRVVEAAQFLLQQKHFSFQIGREGEHLRPVALAPAGLAESGEQSGEAGDAGIEIPHRSWGLAHPGRLRLGRPLGDGAFAG